MKISEALTLGELVAERPERSKVFERLGLDYCCGGKRSLEDACREKGLDRASVMAELEACEKNEGVEPSWQTASIAELCGHIEQTHHAYLKAELPALQALVSKVLGAHGQNHPELYRVAELVGRLREELESHLLKEEQILFPMCRELERAQALPEFHCGSVGNPIRVMEYEHDQAGDAVHQIRRLTAGYAVPTGACNSYRAMLARLEALELDLHQHVHKENNILFPRVQKLEADLSK